MKTWYITRGNNIFVNTEDNTAIRYNASRSAIDDVFLMKEDTHIVYSYNGYKKELDAKAGDIVVTFYAQEFPTPIVIVNNEDWKNNITAYDELMQKQKEEWAAKKSADINTQECTDCESISKF